jgi:predicted TIM-barrel fold metal-dependent hydrolase
MARQAVDSSEVLITADAHVSEPDDINERLPKELRKYGLRFSDDPYGTFDLDIEGYTFRAEVVEAPTEIEKRKEFRTDPTGGRDLSVRLRHMAVEGVDAQVIFPNGGLLVGSGAAPPEFRIAFARAYNDWAWENFSSDRDRFCVAAMIPTETVDAAVTEAKRMIDLGCKTLFLPPSVPWEPYYLDCWDPLWSLAEEANVVLNFHVFAGNLGFAADFAHVLHMGEYETERSRKSRETFDGLRQEMLSTTVIGMAAGMGPVVHLTASGALERHPNLRFIVTEAEGGWLAFTLQQMDRMQDRRHIFLKKLSLKPSEFFLRQGHVTLTDDPVALNNIRFTGADCYLWGNDYPHDEGTYPLSHRYIDQIRATLSVEDTAKVLSGNAARLFGFDLERLAARKQELRAAA